MQFVKSISVACAIAGTVFCSSVLAQIYPSGPMRIIVPSGFAVNPSVYKTLPFDSVKDLAPVTQLASSPLVLVVHRSFPPKNVKELIAFLEARPGDQLRQLGERFRRRTSQRSSSN